MSGRALLLHGPNLNFLGRRAPEHYGRITLAELVERITGWAARHALIIEAFQSNHEGALIDKLQSEADRSHGAIVNLGALTHSSYALHDALVDFGRPVVEVHLSKISEREAWRRISVIRPACVESVEGLGPEGYRVAIEKLSARLAGPGHRASISSGG